MSYGLEWFRFNPESEKEQKIYKELESFNASGRLKPDESLSFLQAKIIVYFKDDVDEDYEESTAKVFIIDNAKDTPIIVHGQRSWGDDFIIKTENDLGKCDSNNAKSISEWAMNTRI